MSESFLDLMKSIWGFTVFSGASVTIQLGRLLLGLIILAAGWWLLKYGVHHFGRQLFLRWFKEEDPRIWFENFLIFLLHIILFISVLLIVGIPLTAFGRIWRFPVFTIKEHPVTLGNILLGLILLYPGIRLSRYVSQRFHTIFLERLVADLATKKSLETLVRYILVAIVILFVLTFIGIPLTAFTLLGGALAIGIGLGSQNLVNNFLSGLVLMMERPLKVGDVVEIEERPGTVEHIGGRATRIKTFDNVRLVMPNSRLLEHTVINWSLIDNYLRREIMVGVAYGSPTRKVEELILKAVQEHSRAEESPAPVVLFHDFGDNALAFRVLFWVKLDETLRPLVVESDIRYRIDELFQEAGITIAFPQRDVHLDAPYPLEVKMVNPRTPTGRDKQ